MDRPCSFCGGAAHPATGCEYSATIIACWRCTEEAWSWVKGHTDARQGRKRRDGTMRPATALSFYEAAGKK